VAISAVALATLAVTARTARAAEDDAGRPWFPPVGEGVAPLNVYDDNALSIVHGGDDGWHINRGRYLTGLSRTDFFVTVGRADLASRERSSQSTRTTLIWTGGATLLIGTLVFYATVSRGGFDPSPFWGLGIMAAGGITIVTGLSIHGPNVTGDEADVMVRSYNVRLKSHIEEETGTGKPKPIQARLEMVTPFVDGRSGGGLLAVARF
jgi:hypothetical protein